MLIDSFDEGLLVKNTVDSVPVLLAHALEDRENPWPSWLRVIATSRRDSEVLNTFRKAQVSYETIDPRSDENQSDLRVFVLERLSQMKYDLITGPSSTDSQTGLKHTVTIKTSLMTDSSLVSSKLLEKAGGNFQYAKMALDDIRGGRVSTLEDLDNLPSTLDDLYEQRFEKQFPAEEFESKLKPLLEVILASKEPLNAEQIGVALGYSSLEEDSFEENVLRPIANLEAYLHISNEGSFSICHQSFADWLTEEVRVEDDTVIFKCHLQEGHRRLAESGNRREMKLYCLRYGVQHAIESCQVELLEASAERLVDWHWLYEKVRQVGAVEAIEDAEACLQAAAARDIGDRIPTKAIELVRSALWLSLPALEKSKEQLAVQLAGRLLVYEQDVRGTYVGREYDAVRAL